VQEKPWGDNPGSALRGVRLKLGGRSPLHRNFSGFVRIAALHFGFDIDEFVSSRERDTDRNRDRVNVPQVS
jgi:hypothetical protein